jgi:uncharacterized membrane protein YkvI
LICIAGGYGTGRELVQFFLLYGPAGGLLGMIPATLIVSATCMIGFELARKSRTYDYRSFLQVLLGRGWFIYEIAYLFSIVLILAVIGSARDQRKRLEGRDWPRKGPDTLIYS